MASQANNSETRISISNVLLIIVALILSAASSAWFSLAFFPGLSPRVVQLNPLSKVGLFLLVLVGTFALVLTCLARLQYLYFPPSKPLWRILSTKIRHFAFLGPATGIGLLFLAFYGMAMMYSWQNRNAWIEPSGLAISLVDVFSLVGILATLAALLVSLHQYKLADDRIDDYYSFFGAVDQLLNEIRERKAFAMYFYFSGSTILPGNISHEDAARIRRFGEELELLVSGAMKGKNDFGILSSAHFAVPHESEYNSIYSFFLRHALPQYRNDPTKWQEVVRMRQKEAVACQNAVLNLIAPDCSNVVIKRLHARDLNLVSGSYVLCNGRRLVYAIPLHYSEPSVEGGGTYHPQLIGFTSVDRLLVRSYIDTFKRQFAMSEENNEKTIGQGMYKRHILNPVLIGRCIDSFVELQPPADVSSRHELNGIHVLDQDHFGGKDATQLFIDRHAPKSNSRVLDIGCGYGGPARQIATASGCSVDGVDIQSARIDVGVRLNSLTMQHNLVKIWKADIAKLGAGQQEYEFVVAWLSLLHTSGKPEVLSGLGTWLKPGGILYIEDFCAGKWLDSGDEKTLQDVVSCPKLLVLSDYLAFLESGGIQVISVEDLSDDWLRIAESRQTDFSSRTWVADSKWNELVEQLASDQEKVEAQKFAQDVVKLFKDRLVRGVRVTGRKQERRPGE